MELKLPRSRVLRGAYLMVQRYLRHNVGIQSAALAFYLLFMLFPFLIFISALLGLLAGVLRPDRGEIVWGEGVRGRIGYVPQELSLYSGLTGLENLRFWAKACGLPGRAVPARSRWLLERLELTEKGSELVSAYSGGMKRRLHLASALMVTPRLLLLDEPTAGADERSAELILDLIGHMRGQGCGVVLTSHRAGELERACGRLLTLEAGRPVEGAS